MLRSLAEVQCENRQLGPCQTPVQYMRGSAVIFGLGTSMSRDNGVARAV
jgi:hypothetical protein